MKAIVRERMKKLAVIAGLLLSGCTTIDYSRKVEGWPQMRVEVNRVSYQVMRQQCDKYAGFSEIIFACSEFWFNPPVCRVWVVEGDTKREEHELAHCAGYDHNFGSSMTTLKKANDERERQTRN